LIWMAVTALLAVTLAGLSFFHFRETAPARTPVHLQLVTPGPSAVRYLALSPDGQTLAFIANNGGPEQLWVRSLGSGEAKPMAGTNGATLPFWSPDNAWLGFFADRKLKKIAPSGGPPQTLCDVSDPRGGTWNRAGVILFSAGPRSPIMKVSTAGGTPAAALSLPPADPSAGQRFPFFLSDGDHFLFNGVGSNAADTGVFLGALSGGHSVRLLPDQSNAIFVADSLAGRSGHVLFRRERTLMALPFDSQSLKAQGDAIALAENVVQAGFIGEGVFAASQGGELVYRAAATESRELAWFDRNGGRLSTLGQPGDFGPAVLSPDGRNAAVVVNNGVLADIWIEDVTRGVMSRLTSSSVAPLNSTPVWSPDGTRVAYGVRAAAGGDVSIFVKSTGGAEKEELLFHAGVNGDPEDWSFDGKWLSFRGMGLRTSYDTLLLPLTGERKPLPYLQTPAAERGARFSPDGKWMAYDSDESGRLEIYVQAIPTNGRRFQISTAGGASPQWRRDGKEIFYVSADQKLMAVSVKTGGTFEPGTPQTLFGYAGALSYSPSPDGHRFLLNMPAGVEASNSPSLLTFVLNWQAGLKK
jgi:Tol biopolymer transport system component